MDLNSSPDMCTEVPLPEDAILILLTLFLQYAKNSATLFAGKLGGTTMTLGVRTNPATGAISRMKLNGRFLYKVALIPLAGLTNNIV